MTKPIRIESGIQFVDVSRLRLNSEKQFFGLAGIRAGSGRVRGGGLRAMSASFLRLGRTFLRFLSQGRKGAKGQGGGMHPARTRISSGKCSGGTRSAVFDRGRRLGCILSKVWERGWFEGGLLIVALAGLGLRLVAEFWQNH